jgi:hypothetical protein
MSDTRDLLREAIGSFEPRGDLRAVERRVERRRRTQQISAGVVGLCVFAAGGWLALTAFRPGDGTPGSTPTQTVATVKIPNVVGISEGEARGSLEALGLTVSLTTGPSDEIAEGLVAAQDPPAGVTAEAGTTVTLEVSGGPSLTDPIPLGELPEIGVAVGSGDTVELVDLEGMTVETLPGFALAGNPGAPGVWLVRDGDYFSLDVREHALIPMPADEARSLIDDEGPEPSLPPPPVAAGATGEPAGHWRYTIESPSGLTLAQWSGECEVPIAYWIDQAGRARIVTGGSDVSVAPSSLALGWSQSGEAIVLVSSGSCGGSADRPGIYLYSLAGIGRLVHPAEAEPVTADAWGTGLGRG